MQTAADDPARRTFPWAFAAVHPWFLRRFAILPSVNFENTRGGHGGAAGEAGDAETHRSTVAKRGAWR